MKQELRFTPIDLRAWPRGETFYYFAKMAPIGYSLTVEPDVTHLRAALRSKRYKFFPAYLWLVTKCLNEQMEFRLAEADGQLGCYNVLTPFYAHFHEDDHTFPLLWTEYDDDFAAFHTAYLADKARHGAHHGILGKAGEVPPPNAYTVSCVPWVSFRHFAVHSYERKDYYFPSVEAGSFYEKDGRLLLPLSLTVHHAAADGWHVSRFLERLQEEMDRFDA